MATQQVHTKNIFKRDITEVLRAPRITEKASIASESRVYVFNIAPWANKNQVVAAVKKLYKVTPKAVRTVSIPAKKVFRRGSVGMTNAGKKAYVELKQGDKIELA